MRTADLATRVTWAGAWTVAALGAGAWWLAGLPAAAGVTGGGVIGLINFRWLAGDLRRAVALVTDGQTGLARVGRIGLRQLFTFGALGVLIAQGWAHPVAVGVGLAALPPVLLAQGLLSAREES